MPLTEVVSMKCLLDQNVAFAATVNDLKNGQKSTAWMTDLDYQIQDVCFDFASWGA